MKQTIPEIHVHFTNAEELQCTIKTVVIDTFKKAIDSATGDVKALTELLQVAKEFRWAVDEKLGEAIYGPKKENKETLPS